MKINLLSSFAGIALSLAMSGAADGQSNITAQHSRVTKVFTPSASPDENYNLNGKAVRDFTRSFKNVSGERWSDSPNSHVVTFTLHDIDYTLFYDQRGDRLYTMQNYHGAAIPADITHLVKKVYDEYQITLVQEVTNDIGESAYVIHLEGETQWVTARLANGEINEFERFDKSE
jgi:hypothetical protein